MLVTESPAFVSDEAGNPGLERVFTVENAPADASIMLAVTLNSLVDDRSFSTNGGFEIAEQENGSVTGWLTLRNNESTTLTSYFGEPAVVRETDDDGPAKPLGLQLIEGSDCAACHNAEVQTVGPSYTAIAERYPKDDLTVVRLAGKIISGGSGVWGEALMTPHPTLEQEDAKRMVEYILSLGGAEDTGGGPLDVPGDIYPLTEQRDGSAAGSQGQLHGGGSAPLSRTSPLLSLRTTTSTMLYPTPIGHNGLIMPVFVITCCIVCPDRRAGRQRRPDGD